jgi:hypothetical protein
MLYLLLFYGNNGYANALQYYFKRKYEYISSVVEF